MESVFLNNENKISEKGIYGVNFYTLGVKHTVIVDDYLLVKSDGAGGWKTHGSKVGLDGSLWGAILEKAFAKYTGNYEHTIGGNPALSLRTLYGSPEEYVKHKKLTAAALWTKLTAAEARGDIL